MSHSIKHLWAARDGNRELFMYNDEPKWDDNAHEFMPDAGLCLGDIDEDVIDMPWISPGMKRKVTISVTAE